MGIQFLCIFDGSTTDDFNGSTDGNTAYNKEPFAEWGYYALTNTYVGYGDKVSNGVKAPTNPSMGGKTQTVSLYTLMRQTAQVR